MSAQSTANDEQAEMVGEPLLQNHNTSSSTLNTGEGEPRPSIWAEWVDMIWLAFPIFIAFSSWAAMKTTDTALLGHAGTNYLSAVAVSDLWTSSSGVLIEGGVLGIFVSQAMGAGNKKLAGVHTSACFGRKLKRDSW
jgi:Na+-driven multidrug efflux pump